MRGNAVFIIISRYIYFKILLKTDLLSGYVLHVTLYEADESDKMRIDESALPNGILKLVWATLPSKLDKVSVISH